MPIGYGAKKVTPEELDLAWGIVELEQECTRAIAQRDQLLQRMKDIREETFNLENGSQAELARRLNVIEAMARSMIARVEAGDG